jgi:rRNA maturation RNase YbeY
MNFPALPDELPDESMVSFHFEDVAFDMPDESGIAEWLTAIAREEERALVELNVIFCSDEHLRQINITYLDHDYYTDVITFPYAEDVVHGDVFISIDRVRDNAAGQGVTFGNELLRIMAHGVLHLAGYGDKTPEDKVLMTQKEDYYLQQAPLF